MVFIGIPLGLSPNKGFQHMIELEIRTKLIIITPYRHPRRLKEETENN